MQGSVLQAPTFVGIPVKVNADSGGKANDFCRLTEWRSAWKRNRVHLRPDSPRSVVKCFYGSALPDDNPEIRTRHNGTWRVYGNSTAGATLRQSPPKSHLLLRSIP